MPLCKKRRLRAEEQRRLAELEEKFQATHFELVRSQSLLDQYGVDGAGAAGLDPAPCLWIDMNKCAMWHAKGQFGQGKTKGSNLP